MQCETKAHNQSGLLHLKLPPVHARVLPLVCLPYPWKRVRYSATIPPPNTSTSLPMPHIADIPVSLYIHLPWCVQKCPYCDFNSHATGGSSLPEAAYAAALLEELDSQ